MVLIYFKTLIDRFITVLGHGLKCCLKYNKLLINKNCEIKMTLTRNGTKQWHHATNWPCDRELKVLKIN